MTRISLDLTLNVEDATQAAALDRVMRLLEAEAAITVEHLEATCPGCGDPIDESEDAEPHACA